MKIFVTGGTGFIGSNFLNKVISEGHEVIALKRSKSSQPRVELVQEPIWITRQLDELLVEDFTGVDVIVHFAAHSMTPPYDTLENCIQWNVVAPISAFKKAIEAGVKKFIVAGSCFEYGLSGENYEFIPPDAPLVPTLTYAVSKASASMAFVQLALEKNIQLSIQRIFHVFGPGESDNRLWPSLKLAAQNGKDFPMTEGDQLRDFIHVDKVVQRFYELCCDKEIPFGSPLIENLGSGRSQSVLEFSQFWWNKWDATGKLLIGEMPYREGEVMRYVPAIVKPI